MSQQYEYLGNQLNYLETEGYESFEQYHNDEQEEQTFEADAEVVEEQNVENEVSKLRYQDADALIQTEIKEIIFKKETEKTTVKILTEHKNNILNQINDLQNLRDIVGEENEVLNMNSEIEKDEIMNLQKRVAYNGEIVDRLEEFVRTIENGFQQFKSRRQQYSTNLINQKNKILNHNAQHGFRISQLKADIDNKKKSNNDVTNDSKKEENLLLKAELIKKQEYLNQLKERYQQTELKKEQIKEMANKKEELENILNVRRIHLQEQNDVKNQEEVNSSSFIKDLNIKKEETKKSLDNFRRKLENINKEISEANTVKDTHSKALLLKEDLNSELEEKISKITVDITEQQVALEDIVNKCKQNTDTAQNELKTSRNYLTDISNENYELSSSLEIVRQEYITKIKDKNTNLLKKLELEKKLSSDEIILSNIKLLEEQIALKKKTEGELLEKNQKLSTDDALQDLNKKKAYLISSTDYLNEKLENNKTQLGNITKVIEDLQSEVDSNLKSIQEKQEKCDALLVELQQVTTDAAVECQLNTTPTGILKSKVAYNKVPISPKKVHFEGLSSYDSSISDPVLSGSNQQTMAGRTFDDIWQEIQAESSKTPLKSPKKRKVEIDIE